MLVKATDDQFHSVVGQRDQGILYGVDQLGIVTFQEIKDAFCFRHLKNVAPFQVHHLAVALADGLLTLGLEDAEILSNVVDQLS